MDEPFVIAGNSVLEWLVFAQAQVLWALGDTRFVAGLLLVPALLSLFASSVALTLGLLGLAVAFLVHVEGLAAGTAWEPVLPLLFALSGLVTVIGGFRARARSRAYRSECERLEAETQTLQRHLDRERLWRAAGGSTGALISDDELRDIRSRLDRHLESREGTSLLSEPRRGVVPAPAAS